MCFKHQNLPRAWEHTPVIPALEVEGVRRTAFMVSFETYFNKTSKHAQTLTFKKTMVTTV